MSQAALAMADEYQSKSLLHPVALAERIELLDVLRGFALYGVLLVNMLWLSADAVLSPAQLAGFRTAPLDTAFRYAVKFFFEGKFLTLFSILFGLGFAIQLSRAEAAGASFVKFYVRRLLILLLIGIAHALLLWYGDILSYYALMGLLLILFRHCKDKSLLLCGIVLAALIPPLMIAIAHFQPLWAGGQASALFNRMTGGHVSRETRFAVFSAGTYLEALRTNARYFVSEAFLNPAHYYIFLFVLGRFLLGFYAGRRGMLHEPSRHLPLFRQLFWWGLGIGLCGAAL